MALFCRDIQDKALHPASGDIEHQRDCLRFTESQIANIGHDRISQGNRAQAGIILHVQGDVSQGSIALIDNLDAEVGLLSHSRLARTINFQPQTGRCDFGLTAGLGLELIICAADLKAEPLDAALTALQLHVDHARRTVRWNVSQSPFETAAEFARFGIARQILHVVGNIVGRDDNISADLVTRIGHLDSIVERLAEGRLFRADSLDRQGRSAPSDTRQGALQQQLGLSGNGRPNHINANLSRPRSDFAGSLTQLHCRLAIGNRFQFRSLRSSRSEFGRHPANNRVANFPARNPGSVDDAGYRRRQRLNGATGRANRGRNGPDSIDPVDNGLGAPLVPRLSVGCDTRQVTGSR